MTPLAAGVNELALAIFALVLAITLGITYWASKRTTRPPSSGPPAAAITGVQNGLAIAGDYMSASSFLGFAGLVFLFGFDGVSYADRLRSSRSCPCCSSSPSGCATRASTRSPTSCRSACASGPARMAAALGTLAVAARSTSSRRWSARAC